MNKVHAMTELFDKQAIYESWMVIIINHKQETNNKCDDQNENCRYSLTFYREFSYYYREHPEIEDCSEGDSPTRQLYYFHRFDCCCDLYYCSLLLQYFQNWSLGQHAEIGIDRLLIQDYQADRSLWRQLSGSMLLIRRKPSWSQLDLCFVPAQQNLLCTSQHLHKR